MINKRIENIKLHMRDEGISYIAVANKLGVSKGTIAYWFNFLKHPWLIDRIEEAVCELIKEGVGKLGKEEHEKSAARVPIKARRKPIPPKRNGGAKCLECVWATRASESVVICAFPQCIKVKRHEAHRAQHNN